MTLFDETSVSNYLRNAEAGNGEARDKIAFEFRQIIPPAPFKNRKHGLCS